METKWRCHSGLNATSAQAPDRRFAFPHSFVLCLALTSPLLAQSTASSSIPVLLLVGDDADSDFSLDSMGLQSRSEYGRRHLLHMSVLAITFFPSISLACSASLIYTRLEHIRLANIPSILAIIGCFAPGCIPSVCILRLRMNLDCVLGIRTRKSKHWNL